MSADSFQLWGNFRFTSVPQQVGLKCRRFPSPFYPIPFEPAKFVYVFSGAAMALRKPNDTPALLVNAPSEVVPVPGPRRPKGLMA